MEPTEHESAEQGAKERWSYEELRQYLLLWARKGEMGLEPVSRYPRVIELSSPWHNTLNTMRQETLDGLERFTVVGTTEEKTELFIPIRRATGELTQVPGKVITDEINRVKKLGVVTELGDIHSHPYRYPKRGPAFSSGDLYGLLQFPKRLFAGVVDGEDNLFAFRTKDTHILSRNKVFLSYEAFTQYWNSMISTYGPARLNEIIAEQHNLVLFQGKADQDLQRIYPK